MFQKTKFDYCWQIHYNPTCYICEIIFDLSYYFKERLLTMGSKTSSQKKPKTGNMQQKQDRKLEIQITCPNCLLTFEKGSSIQNFSKHIELCVMNEPQTQEDKQVIQELVAVRKSIDPKKQYIYQKIPLDTQYKKFKWQRVPILTNMNPKLYSMAPNQVSKLRFQEKLAWFRYHLQNMRISWQIGCDWMKIQKTNVLMTSFNQVKKVNMHKEVKIDFLNEKVNDAGGLLRQWMHLACNQIFDESLGIFVRADTEDVTYKIKWDKSLDTEFASDLFELFGTILGKAIFEKIPLDCYIDRSLLRQLCGQRVQLQDIWGYDKGLYQSWKYIKENTVEDLDTYFVVYKELENGSMEEIQLIEKGKQIALTDENKSIYLSLCIQQYCTLSVNSYLNSIKKTLYKIIPEKLLTVFQPFQMEMLLFGVPFIDVDEWMKNTQYKGIYNDNHKVIRWFWQIVLNLNQQQLSRLLHFSTGSYRTPINGFKKLESNRGNTSKFLIESAPYQNANPYPKGHTCFNRLQLPIYPSRMLMQKYLLAICENDLDGIYGLD